VTADKQSHLSTPVSIVNQTKKRNQNKINKNWSQVQGSCKAIWQLDILPDSWTSFNFSIENHIFEFPRKKEKQSK